MPWGFKSLTLRMLDQDFIGIIAFIAPMYVVAACWLVEIYRMSRRSEQEQENMKKRRIATKMDTRVLDLD